MAFSPVYDRGTRFTNYSSIHSADAFVGDYQVMYTPGSASPPAHRTSRKPSRFSKPPSSLKNQNVSQSYLLPSNMPNTSQIVPDHGILPNVQVHYNIPVDEKQIVASLRSLQKDLAGAMQTIKELTRERDEALHELRLLRATSRKPSSPMKKQNMAGRVEEELFDLSRVGEDSPRRSTFKPTAGKKVNIEQKQATVSDNARVISPIPVNAAIIKQSDKRVSSKNTRDSHRSQRQVIVEETEEQSIAYEDPTAASNTSRRRRRLSADENMTSAYILPDITEQQQLQQQHQPHQVSKQAQQVLHSLDPEHVANCDVCHRLTAKSKPVHTTGKLQSPPEPPVPTADRLQNEHKADYTRKLAGFVDESFVDDPTMRPKVAPAHALARVRALMSAQFLRAKERHNEVWLKYDAVEAPLSSRRHAQIGKELTYWAEKMEECRVHLDYLRDVEEGMEDL